MILPSSYFAPILQYALLCKQVEYELEVKERFIKQSYRSRCEIYGANGKLDLIVPLKKWKTASSTEEMEISYDENWPLLHWRSLASAYRNSPYFEFYEEELATTFKKRFRFLIDLNLYAEQQIADLIHLETIPQKTKTYRKTSEPDYRKEIHPKAKSLLQKIHFPVYQQVFMEKYGFIKNLSILDLLFNLGPESFTYLKNIAEQNGKKN